MLHHSGVLPHNSERRNRHAWRPSRTVVSAPQAAKRVAAAAANADVDINGILGGSGAAAAGMGGGGASSDESDEEEEEEDDNGSARGGGAAPPMALACVTVDARKHLDAMRGDVPFYRDLLLRKCVAPYVMEWNGMECTETCCCASASAARRASLRFSVSAAHTTDHPDHLQQQQQSQCTRPRARPTAPRRNAKQSDRGTRVSRSHPPMIPTDRGTRVSPSLGTSRFSASTRFWFQRCRSSALKATETWRAAAAGSGAADAAAAAGRRHSW